MTTRTLGQIASETMAALRAQASAQELSDPAEQAAMWETVAAVLREKIAVWVEPQRNDVPATGAEFAAAIRSMEP